MTRSRAKESDTEREHSPLNGGHNLLATEETPTISKSLPNSQTHKTQSVRGLKL